LQRQSGGHWHIHGTFLGERLRESTWETDRARAEAIMADRFALRLKLHNGRVHRTKATFAEAAAAYLAEGKHSDATVKCTNRIKTIIGEAVFCADVDWAMVKSVANKILRPTSSQQTLKRQVASPMKAVMTWAAMHWGEKRCCPIPKFPEIPDAAPRAILVLPGQAKAMHDAAVASGDLVVADLIAIGFGEGPRR
jgi:hypothetical protein